MAKIYIKSINEWIETTKEEHDNVACQAKRKKVTRKTQKNRSDSSDLREPERFFLCNIIF